MTLHPCDWDLFSPRAAEAPVAIQPLVQNVPVDQRPDHRTPPLPPVPDNKVGHGVPSPQVLVIVPQVAQKPVPKAVMSIYPDSSSEPEPASQKAVEFALKYQSMGPAGFDPRVSAPLAPLFPDLPSAVELIERASPSQFTPKSLVDSLVFPMPWQEAAPVVFDISIGGRTAPIDGYVELYHDMARCLSERQQQGASLYSSKVIDNHVFISNFNRLIVMFENRVNKVEFCRQMVADAAVCAAAEFLKEERLKYQKSVSDLKWKLTHDEVTGVEKDYDAGELLPQVHHLLHRVQNWCVCLRQCRTTWLYTDLSSIRCDACMALGYL